MTRALDAAQRAVEDELALSKAGLGSLDSLLLFLFPSTKTL
jgi:hypothetical protein